jgi:hypothetical protein
MAGSIPNFQNVSEGYSKAPEQGRTLTCTSYAGPEDVAVWLRRQWQRPDIRAATTSPKVSRALSIPTGKGGVSRAGKLQDFLGRKGERPNLKRAGASTLFAEANGNGGGVPDALRVEVVSAGCTHANVSSSK